MRLPTTMRLHLPARPGGVRRPPIRITYTSAEWVRRPLGRCVDPDLLRLLSCRPAVECGCGRMCRSPTGRHGLSGPGHWGQALEVLSQHLRPNDTSVGTIKYQRCVVNCGWHCKRIECRVIGQNCIPFALGGSPYLSCLEMGTQVFMRYGLEFERIPDQANVQEAHLQDLPVVRKPKHSREAFYSMPPFSANNSHIFSRQKVQATSLHRSPRDPQVPMCSLDISTSKGLLQLTDRCLSLRHIQEDRRKQRRNDWHRPISPWKRVDIVEYNELHKHTEWTRSPTTSSIPRLSPHCNGNLGSGWATYCCAR